MQDAPKSLLFTSLAVLCFLFAVCAAVLLIYVVGDTSIPLRLTFATGLSFVLTIGASVWCGWSLLRHAVAWTPFLCLAAATIASAYFLWQQYIWLVAHM